jgi:hypothetical protein
MQRWCQQIDAPNRCTSFIDDVINLKRLGIELSWPVSYLAFDSDIMHRLAAASTVAKLAREVLD